MQGPRTTIERNHENNNTKHRISKTASYAFSLVPFIYKLIIRKSKKMGKVCSTEIRILKYETFMYCG